MNPMLAKKYENQIIAGWLMSEKFDGVRAVWNGKELLSRNGLKFFAPEWFTNQLPKGIMLDGELYIGHGKFQETVGIVRTKTPIDKDWEKIAYCIFDAPGLNETFENRIPIISEIIKNIKICKIVEQKICKSKNEMEEYFNMVCANGGEGIILRNPKSKYEQRRSNEMLKYKPIDSDEAVLIGYQDGAGKYTNAIGALICKWQEKTIKIGAGISDHIRKNSLPLGSAVTFQFNGTTDDGMPRFPIFICVRNYEN